MTFGDWISDIHNISFLVMAVPLLFSAIRVVTARNVVHAALFLVVTLAASAGIFILLSAEFVAWTLVLVYIGAVVVLFLFGIMITKAPIGYDTALDHANKVPAVFVSVAVFLVTAWLSVQAFGTEPLKDIGVATPTEILGRGLIERFTIPFEIVGFILLAALIGGVTLARRDLTPLEEEERRRV